MGTEELLQDILAELKQMRYLLQDRKPTPSGGAYPPNPKVVMQPDKSGIWRVDGVPKGLKWKPCRDSCGKDIAWVETPAGNRPIEKSGIQHKCPNYVPKDQRPPEPEPEPVRGSREDPEIPF